MIHVSVEQEAEAQGGVFRKVVEAAEATSLAGKKGRLWVVAQELVLRRPEII